MKTASKRNNHFSLLVLCLLVTVGCALSAYTFDLGSLGQFTINLDNDTASSQPTLPTVQPVVQYTPTTAPTTRRDDCLAGIIPGVTSSDTVQAVLGAPAAYQKQDDFDILFYQTGTNRQYNTVILSGSVVHSVSVPGGVSDALWSITRPQLGEPEITAYSDAAHGARLFCYPGQGIMIVADDVLDVIYSHTCFVPMTAEAFTEQYGSALLKEDPFVQ